MTKSEVEDLTRRTYNLLNGVVNLHRIDYLEIVERSRYLYDEYLKPIDCPAARVEIPIGGKTILVFAIDRVLEFLSGINEINQPSFVVHLVVHELSHSNQDVDYDRYEKDPYYYRFIEKSNNIYSYRFIDNYKEWLMEKLNIPYLFPVEQDSIAYTEEKLAIIRVEEIEYRMKHPVCWTL